MSKTIYVCSPLSAYEGHTVDQNIHEAREFCRVIMNDGDIPICPQIYLPQFMDDSDPEQRKKALYLCKIVLSKCDLMFVYYGKNKYISDGMREELGYAKYFGIKTVEIPSWSISRGKFAKYKYKEEVRTLEKIRSHYLNTPAILMSEDIIALNTAIKILKEAE